MSTEIDQIRIKTIQIARARGLTSEILSKDAAPWMRAGLRQLEQGGEVTPQILQDADIAQNNQFPK